ncbi:MAG: Crp/Fnr family transcriptional regulator, partial [Parabacteroides sp.]
LTGPTHEQIVCLVKAPSYLGLPTTFGNKINQYSITAITKAEVCFIDMEVFRYLLKENDSFAYDIILDLCQQQLESYRRCANRTQKQTRGNVADVLIEMADQLFESDTFTLPITQSEMGNLVDTSRETISRILSEFDKDGIIHVVGKRIEILNKNSLKLISQNG